MRHRSETRLLQCRVRPEVMCLFSGDRADVLRRRRILAWINAGTIPVAPASERRKSSRAGPRRRPGVASSRLDRRSARRRAGTSRALHARPSVRNAARFQRRRGIRSQVGNPGRRQFAREPRDVLVRERHPRIDARGHPAREDQATRRDRERAHAGVVEAAEPHADDEQHGQAQSPRDVQHVVTLVERHQRPARAFDDDHVGRHAQGAHTRPRSRRGRARCPRARRRDAAPRARRLQTDCGRRASPRRCPPPRGGRRPRSARRRRRARPRPASCRPPAVPTAPTREAARPMRRSCPRPCRSR